MRQQNFSWTPDDSLTIDSDRQCCRNLRQRLRLGRLQRSLGRIAVMLLLTLRLPARPHTGGGAVLAD
jgi:hypothetical protein